MKKVIFNECIFNVDYGKTIDYYNKIDCGHAEECGCENCLRFASNRVKMYSENILNLFNQVGIDYTKEGELDFCGVSDSGGFGYLCEFYFYGNVELNKCMTLAPPKYGGYEFAPVSDKNSIRFYPIRDNEDNYLVQVEILFINIRL